LTATCRERPIYYACVASKLTAVHERVLAHLETRASDGVMPMAADGKFYYAHKDVQSLARTMGAVFNPCDLTHRSGPLRFVDVVIV
jgi:hypothetical protein